MKKKYVKGIVLVLYVLMCCTLFFSNCYADSSSTNTGKKDFFNAAKEWYDEGTVEKVNLEPLTDIITYINLLGTVIIVLATMVLGIKFMVSSAEGKSEVKQNLSTLLVACVFFFGWDSISNLIMPNSKFFLTEGADDFASIVAKVYSLAVFVLDIVAVIVIIYIGVKYIFSGAAGKSNLKGKSAEFIIGIILTFCTLSFLSYTSKVVNDSLTPQVTAEEKAEQKQNAEKFLNSANKLVNDAKKKLDEFKEGAQDIINNIVGKITGN